jgi:hypothetical protein
MPFDIDQYLFDMSQRIHEIVGNVQDLTVQIDFQLTELKCIQHEIASYDSDLDEPDLNGKEEFYRAVEGGDTHSTLP